MDLMKAIVITAAILAPVMASAQDLAPAPKSPPIEPKNISSAGLQNAQMIARQSESQPRFSQIRESRGL